MSSRTKIQYKYKWIKNRKKDFFTFRSINKTSIQNFDSIYNECSFYNMICFMFMCIYLKRRRISIPWILHQVKCLFRFNYDVFRLFVTYINLNHSEGKRFVARLYNVRTPFPLYHKSVALLTPLSFLQLSVDIRQSQASPEYAGSQLHLLHEQFPWLIPAENQFI